MRLDGKISKVAICENCQGFILACHVDYLDKETEKQFTELTNDGFTVKLETADETRARSYTSSTDCKDKKCKPQHPC